MLSLDQQLSEANNRKNCIPSVEKNLYTEPNVFKYHYTTLAGLVCWAAYIS